MGIGLSISHNNYDYQEDDVFETIPEEKNTDQSSSLITVIQPRDYIYVLLKDNQIECFAIKKKDIHTAMERYKNKILVSSILDNEVSYTDKINTDTIHIYSTPRNQTVYSKGRLVSVLKITKVPFYLSKIIGS
jgi:hypothetical protein